ncbi:MAG: peptide chain release factor N(5)-glutamine methyltransferase [Actinomycetota bacterium]|nr:peptide chain release factor N(5)-glutamine methyltransferase [Actinomycetota bacterium]
MSAVTWAELGAEARRRLADAREARWLTEEASGRPGSEWHEPATARGAARLWEMVERRLAGEPLQYVIGHWPFRDLDLLVNRRVLIPRPETEITAEVALEEAMRFGARRGIPDPWGSAPTYAVADLGTGSGALALALATELPEAEVWGTDADPGALDVASANLAGLGVAATRVRLAQGLWYEALPEALRGRLVVIVSNPPYVAEAEYATLPVEVRDHEPRTALVPGPRGTEALEHLLDGAPGWLAPGGAVVLEMAPHHATPLSERAAAIGYRQVEVRADLTGRDRVLVART